MSTRRTFLKDTALGLSAAGIWTQLPSTGKLLETTGPASKDALPVGIAGYTFHNFDLDQSIAMMKRVNISYMSLKDFLLPLDSSPEKIDAVMARFRTEGISIYAAGVIYMKKEADADQAFEYAKKLGVPMIVGSPVYDLLPYVEKKVTSYNIRLAIHNHGPEDKLYPGPGEIFERIKKMDSRMGICLDIGHALRAGTDPVKAVGDYSSRLFDLHIKDLSEVSQVDKSVELGRGVMNIPGLVTELKKIQYPGKCSIEFEMPVKDPLPGIAESVGFLRGVIRTLS
jgi:sugar phosphate isomerase/epimerase